MVRLASEDPLTGLPNRRLFRSTLDQLSVRCSAAPEATDRQAEFAVLFLDLDRFKVVNDTLGSPHRRLLLQESRERG